MDLVQFTWTPPPHPPLKMDYVFFSPLFYRSFPIFRHNFYIKSKKNVNSGLGPKPPPPLWTKSIQMLFFVFFTSLIIYLCVNGHFVLEFVQFISVTS